MFVLPFRVKYSTDRKHDIVKVVLASEGNFIENEV